MSKENNEYLDYMKLLVEENKELKRGFTIDLASIKSYQTELNIRLDDLEENGNNLTKELSELKVYSTSKRAELKESLNKKINSSLIWSNVGVIITIILAIIGSWKWANDKTEGELANLRDETKELRDNIREDKAMFFAEIKELIKNK